MTDFHPDCTINILLLAQGRPAKYVWVCSLVTRESVRLVTARRFAGIVSREQAEASALLFGMKQAERLLQEKVQLSADFQPFTEGHSGGRHKDPGVQLMKAEAEKIWSSFRLRKMARIAPDEERLLKEEAEKGFARKSRD